MRTHIKVVAIVNIILGALGVLGMLLGIVGGALGSLFSGSFVQAIVGTVVSATFGLVFAAFAALRMLAGFGLLSGKSWARYTIIICSAVGIFTGGWIGIFFGIYALWVLLSSEGQREFATGTV